MAPGHHHRSGGLRQANKKNKRRTASKRSQNGKGRGFKHSRGSAAAAAAQSKADRRNQAAQRRQAKRTTKLQKSRQPPKVIGLVGLGNDPNADVDRLWKILVKTEGVTTERDAPHMITLRALGGKLTLMKSAPGSVTSALDLARVCDALLFVLGTEETSTCPDGLSTTSGTTMKTSSPLESLISSNGDVILRALKGQGLPTPITVLVSSTPADDPTDDAMSLVSARSERRAHLHLQQQLARDLQRFATTEFGQSAKVSMMHGPTEAPRLVRLLTEASLRPPQWVEQQERPYVLAESVNVTSGVVQLTGYIRQGVWDVNSAVHIPGVGTTTCRSVQAGPSVCNADPELQEGLLDMYATPDALMGEQNLVGFDEVDDEEEESIAPKTKQQEYQAPWLDALDDVDPSDAVTYDFNTVTPDDDDEMMLDDDDDDGMDKDARRKQFTEDAEFPDEVQVDEDMQARDRFQRYRSLKNFRRTHWDPKENLPESYANIFHFRQFAQTQRAIRKDREELQRAASAINNEFFGGTPRSDDIMDQDEDEDILQGCVPAGSYVTLTLEQVSPEFLKRLAACAFVVATSLLEHETKVSVLHTGIKSCVDADAAPIKSKDVLTFRCGWRQWQARPVFSQHNFNSDKHKLERFLPPSAFVCASLFGPVTYAPCPVLVFRNDELVGVGSVLGADADRIVVKRILLTGYPVRVRKRTATVKYMFYNPEDVKWFQPAGLHTKHGLQGHIVQSVGEHGTMKCLFNAPIQQHDTVCLPLYKRIYPKYAPLEASDGTTEDITVL